VFLIVRSDLWGKNFILKIVEASPKAETIRKLSEWLRALSAGLRINAGGIPPLQQLNFSLNLARKSMRHMEEDKVEIYYSYFRNFPFYFSKGWIAHNIWQQIKVLWGLQIVYYYQQNQKGKIRPFKIIGPNSVFLYLFG